MMTCEAALMIEECDHAQVAHWRSAAARERVCLKSTEGTRWFRCEDRGCAGLLRLGSGVLRIKGVYVDRRHRGQGIGAALTEHLIRLAEEEGASALEVYALEPGWYEERGFVKVGRNAFGVDRLRKELSK